MEHFPEWHLSTPQVLAVKCYSSRFIFNFNKGLLQTSTNQTLFEAVKWGGLKHLDLGCLGYLTFLCLSFLIYKTGRVTVSRALNKLRTCKAHRTVHSTWEALRSVMVTG